MKVMLSFLRLAVAVQASYYDYCGYGGYGDGYGGGYSRGYAPSYGGYGGYDSYGYGYKMVLMYCGLMCDFF